MLAGQRLHRPVLSRLALGNPCRVNQPAAGGPPLGGCVVGRAEREQERERFLLGERASSG
jgi:hypothetical protein